MRIGKRQLEWLCGVAKPGTFFVAPSFQFQPLLEKGLLKSWGADNSWVGITSAWLRAIADAVDAGRVDLSTRPLKKTDGKP